MKDLKLVGKGQIVPGEEALEEGESFTFEGPIEKLKFVLEFAKSSDPAAIGGNEFREKQFDFELDPSKI